MIDKRRQLFYNGNLYHWAVNRVDENASFLTVWLNDRVVKTAYMNPQKQVTQQAVISKLKKWYNNK